MMMDMTLAFKRPRSKRNRRHTLFMTGLLPFRTVARGIASARALPPAEARVARIHAAARSTSAVAPYRSIRLASERLSSFSCRSKLKRRLSMTTSATKMTMIQMSQPVSSHTFSVGVRAKMTGKNHRAPPRPKRARPS